MAFYKDTELKIVGHLLRNPLESMSLHQLANATKLSYVTVHGVVPHLVRKKLVRVEKKGRAHLISVDLERAQIEDVSAGSFFLRKLFLRKYPFLALLAVEINEVLQGKFYTVIVFGSYAQEKPRKDSDVDMLFLIPSEEMREEYVKSLQHVFSLYPALKIDYNVIPAVHFTEMLAQKYSVGRSVFQHGIVLFGAEYYYGLVRDYVRTKGY